MSSPQAGPSSAQAGPSRRPWSAVPPEVAAALRPALPGAIEQVIQTVTREVPAYSVGSDRVAATLRRGVGLALGRLLDLMGQDDDALAGWAPVYERIGAGEYHSGRGLADLLSAYQIGARAAWQAMSRTGVAAGVSPTEVAQLAEAVFAYIDELSSASISGYTREQVADAGRRERARTDLLTRLLAGEAGSDRVAALAEEVGWPLPGTVVAIVPRGSALPAVVPGGLVGLTRQGPLALVGGPVTPAMRGWLQRSTEPMAVGSEVPVAEAGRSAGHARALRGMPQPGSLLASEHLAALLITADAALGRALREQVLGPFEPVPHARRAPLLDTLRSWLRHAGNRAEVGRELHVHPQTVSYRMDRVRELLGTDLEDPQRRWLLLLALMVDQLDAGGSPPGARSAGSGVSDRPAGP